MSCFLYIRLHRLSTSWVSKSSKASSALAKLAFSRCIIFDAFTERLSSKSERISETRSERLTPPEVHHGGFAHEHDRVQCQRSI